MSRRLQELAATAGSKPWVIPYLTAGFPSSSETVDLLLALEDGGAAAVEVGLPFSDPLADGPVIQQTSEQALKGGITLPKILELVSRFRSRSTLPVVLMGYLNPILKYGSARFFKNAAEAGADGLILPDLPTEELSPFYQEALNEGLDWILLAAPTSTQERLTEIDSKSTAFSYCVSVTGVTGARTGLAPDLGEYLDRVHGVAKKPFVVGFGISTADHVRQVSPPAAGAVVGSALLRALQNESSSEARRGRARQLIEDLSS